MKRNRGIQLKLSTAIALSTVLLVAVAGFVLYQVSFSINRTLVLSDIKNTAYRYANEVSIELESMMASARSLASNFRRYADIDPLYRRSYFTSLLRTTLESNERYYSVWTTWEPQVLDGMDAAYVGDPASSDTGRFVATWYRDGKVSTLSGVSEEELATADYYLLAKETKNEFLMEPYYYSYTGDTGDEVFETSIVVPVYEDGTFICEVGIDIELASFQTLLGGIKPYGSGYAMLLSSEGMYVSHPKADSIGKYFREMNEENKVISERVGMDQKIRDGKEYDFVKTSRDSGAQSFFQYVPLRVGNSAQKWSLGIVLPLEIISGLTNQIVFALVPVMFVLALLLSGIVFMLSGVFLAPLGTLQTRLAELAEGAGDLRVRLAHRSRDEIGELAGSFDSFLDSLSTMVRDIGTAANDAAATGDSLARGAADGASALEEIRINVEEMQKKSGILDGEIVRTADETAEVQSFFARLSSNIADQSSRLLKTGTDIRKLSGSIHEDAQEAGRQLAQVKKLQETAREGEKTMAGTMDSIRKIQESATVVSSMLQMINAIAAQTNLLAMNAAIEAAHAGDYGKGFAVVADEIRSLAEEAAKNSKSIAQSIKEIFALITESQKSSALTGTLFASMIGEVNTISTGMEEIRNGLISLSQDGTRAEEVLQSLMESSEHLKQASDQTDLKVRAIADHVAAIRAYSQDSRNGMDEVTVGVRGIWEAVQTIHQSSSENARKVDAIRGLTGRFKT